MNLTVAEVAQLPIPAALFSGDDVIAHTPEWHHAGPGAIAYRVRGTRLVVSTGDTDPVCADVVGRLLDEIDSTAASLPRRQRLRVSMLAASLRVVAGRDVPGRGHGADVVEYACAGIAARTALHVRVESVDDCSVEAPAVAGLVLVQLAANAERHDRATEISLGADGRVFELSWPGAAAPGGAVTARRRAERARWGLGFARIAADAIGGVVFPPVDEDGVRCASLELGVNRLALPVAQVRDGCVQKATRAWDEETGMMPGAPVPAEGRLATCVTAATGNAGRIATVEGWCARAVPGGTWVAIPPDSIVDRARDVLDGIVHERAMWDSVPEPHTSRIVALASIVGSMLGGDLDRVSGETWNRRARDVADAYGLAMSVPRFEGAGAVDPRVALFLAAEFGERIEADGDELRLWIAPRWRDDPLVRVFLSPGEESIRLG